MRTTVAKPLSIIFLTALIAAGCAGAKKGPTLPEQTARLAEQLRQSNLEVTEDGVMRQPYFTAIAHKLRVQGETVQVFEYPVVTMAKAEVLTVSEDGRSVATVDIPLAGPPHFYSRDRIIVLYVGGNPAIEGALTKTVGPPFAGEGVDHAADAGLPRIP
jgi:hypothetical protein